MQTRVRYFIGIPNNAFNSWHICASAESKTLAENKLWNDLNKPENNHINATPIKFIYTEKFVHDSYWEIVEAKKGWD